MKRFLHVGLSPLPDMHSQGLKSACIANGWEYQDIPTSHPGLNSEIIRVANEYKPDLCFIQIQSDGLEPNAIAALKDNNCFCINWSGDMRSILPSFYFDYAKWGVDLTCFSNMQDVNIMRSCGYESHFLQIGVSPEIYNNTGEINNCCDIIFCGNTFGHFPLSGMRRDMVKELKRVYGDKFKAFGSGQPDGAHSPNNQQGEAAIYRGAKIGINLSHFDVERYSSDRLFKMLACNLLVLSHEYKGIYEDFNPHDIGLWRDFGELKSQIDYYLSNEEARVKIAANGHQKAIEKYSFYQMGIEILNLYNKYNAGNS